MARNQEKSQSMLNRWLTRNQDDSHQKRPYLASLVDDVRKCEKWRRQIVREIGDKVALIQNPGLGEVRIRDLNDEINKLLREKWHWERRIVELNGPDYSKQAKIFDEDGREALTVQGYKYFGAAKQLQGVKELYEERSKQAEEEKSQRSKQDIYKNIDASYFGYNDDEDELLSQLEKTAEERSRQEELTAYQQSTARFKAVASKDLLSATGYSVDVTTLTIPTSEDIEKALLEKRKRALLQRL